jgi:hypothetical protein
MKKRAFEPFKFGQKKTSTRTYFPAMRVKQAETAPASSSGTAKTLKQATAGKK